MLLTMRSCLGLTSGRHISGSANQTVPFATAATNPNTTKNTTFNKVVKVKMSKLHNRKVEFEKLKKTHVSLDDCTADNCSKFIIKDPSKNTFI